VGVERQGVEKEIGQPMARKVLGGRYAFANEPRWIDATRRGYAAGSLGGNDVTQQPQHAAMTCEQPSALERRGGDRLGVVVEGRHETIVGQPGGASIRKTDGMTRRVGDEMQSGNCAISQ
jgi:hypothetical protein